MPTKKKANILLVDDNIRNITSLERMLARPERTFITATNGKDALKAALNKDVDIILLNVQMPVMDGFEVAQILKTNRRTRDVPIIFVSAEKKETQFDATGFEEGAVEYLYKPLEPAATEAKVSTLLQHHLQKKEIAEKNAILEKYALLIDNSSDIICILDAKTLKFEEMNQATSEILGYPRKELTGTSLLFYLPEEDRVRIESLGKQNKEKFSFETRIYTGGRLIKRLNWNVINHNGQWFSNARDITGEKEAQEIRNYLATIVKQSNEAVYLHDADGKIISWNKGAEKIYGFTEKEALQMKIWNIVPDHLLAETQQVVNNILEGAEVSSVATTRITKRGQVIDVLFSASVLLDADNNLQSIAITERDITEELKASRDLQKALMDVQLVNKELESFSYSVSHDLRAPLRALNGYSHILEEEYGYLLDEEGKRMLASIHYNARRMGMLIDDLLAFSRLGRKQVQKLEVDMEEMVADVLQDLQASTHHRATIEVSRLSPAYADRALLKQVWVNLISNALKYSAKSDSPRIIIGSLEENQKGECGYYVSDNGVGFDMEYAGKLFGVFQRLHSDEEFEGTGVGLAIVHRIISRHGGRVWAKAEPGAGATFYFALPLPADGNKKNVTHGY
jgi:PAS domain S-box-containing protein